MSTMTEEMFQRAATPPARRRFDGADRGVHCLLTVGMLAALALALGMALHPLAVDDAFITYRYARNLATGQGFTYNVGQPALSTTAPLWALLLAGGALLWPDIPSLANALSAAALGVGALLVYLLGRHEGRPWVGRLAALLFVLHPLLWLNLGLETTPFLALALSAILAYRRGRLALAALLLALATLIRGDGLILAAVLAADRVLFPHRDPDPGALRRGGQAVRAAALYLLTMLPVLAWLTWQFGSPLPATLAAKRAQAGLGITGFYAHTTCLQGLGILARARLAQSPLYLLFLPAVAVGLVAMWRRAGWVRLLVLWGAVHLLGYTLLGVTPYSWYYAPLVPGLSGAAALGLVEGVRRPGRAGWPLALLWAAGLLLPLAWSDLALIRAMEGPLPPPEEPVSKVLPEAKVRIYEQAGRWLGEHTPPDALIGVTEVGIMGYYAGRPMLDFLGLLRPEVAEAVARGDLSWALLRYQPDYLALTAISPLYAYDLRADPWFQAAYAPLQSFDDPRFWGSPLTIYRRQIERIPLAEPAADGLPAGAIRLDAGFGGQIRLLGAVVGDQTVQPGDLLVLTLYWQAVEPVGQDYTAFVHLLGRYDRVLAQRDATPGLGALPTSRWTPGQVVADPYLLALPEVTCAPDQAVWEVGLYDPATGRRLPLADGGDNVRFGRVEVETAARPLHLDFGPVALTGYEPDRLALAAGEALRVTLHWAGEGPAGITVRLVSEQGEIAARADGDPGQAVYTLTLPADAPAGAYDLEVLVTDPATGKRWPLLGADGQPRSDRAWLTRVRVYAP